MLGEVILCVHELARSNLAGRQVQFRWRDGTEIEDYMEEADNMHDEDFVPEKHSLSSSIDRSGGSKTEGSNVDTPEDITVTESDNNENNESDIPGGVNISDGSDDNRASTSSDDSTVSKLSDSSCEDDASNESWDKSDEIMAD